jgi:hypothetical protein
VKSKYKRIPTTIQPTKIARPARNPMITVDLGNQPGWGWLETLE